MYILQIIFLKLDTSCIDLKITIKEAHITKSAYKTASSFLTLCKTILRGLLLDDDNDRSKR